MILSFLPTTYILKLNFQYHIALGSATTNYSVPVVPMRGLLKLYDLRYYVWLAGRGFGIDSCLYMFPFLSYLAS